MTCKTKELKKKLNITKSQVLLIGNKKNDKIEKINTVILK